MAEIDRLFFEIDQIFVFISPVPLIYYLILKISKKESLGKWFMLGAIIASAAALFLLFKYGISEGEMTYFTTKFQPHAYAFNIFVAMAVFIIILSGFDIFRRMAGWLKNKTITESYDFFYSLAILVYLLIGTFDEQGLIAGWPVVFFRLSYLSVFLMVYLSFSGQLAKKEILIKETHD